MQFHIVTSEHRAESLKEREAYVKSLSNRTVWGWGKFGIQVKWSYKAYIKTLCRLRREAPSKAEYYMVQEAKRYQVALDEANASYRNILLNAYKYGNPEWYKAELLATTPSVTDSKEEAYAKSARRAESKFDADMYGELWDAALSIIRDCCYIEDRDLYEQSVYLHTWNVGQGKLVESFIRAVLRKTGPYVRFEPAEERPDEPLVIHSTEERKPQRQSPYKWLKGRNYTLTVLDFLLDGWKEPLVDTIPVPVYRAARSQAVPRRFQKQMNQFCGQWLEEHGMMDYSNSIAREDDIEEPSAMRVRGRNTRISFGRAPGRPLLDEESVTETIWSVG